MPWQINHASWSKEARSGQKAVSNAQIMQMLEQMARLQPSRADQLNPAPMFAPSIPHSRSLCLDFLGGRTPRH